MLHLSPGTDEARREIALGAAWRRDDVLRIHDVVRVPAAEGRVRLHEGRVVLPRLDRADREDEALGEPEPTPSGPSLPDLIRDLSRPSETPTTPPPANPINPANPANPPGNPSITLPDPPHNGPPGLTGHRPRK